MSLFNQALRGYGADMPKQAMEGGTTLGQLVRPRTFKESIADQIAYHQRKVEELQAVHNSLTPEIERFVEAMQQLG